MTGLELALQRVESAHQKLISENPADFDIVGATALERGEAIKAVADVMKMQAPTARQISRLKRVNLDGMVYLERVRLARQALREELATAGKERNIVSGYQSGSGSPA